MTSRSNVSPRTRLSAICLALAEATASTGQHIKFEVRGKAFAYYLDDHHGDGRVALNCKVATGDQDVLLRMDPEAFFMPAYLGAKGWIGMRLESDDVDWQQVEQLVTDSYRMIAPKRLAAMA
jgi:hypothetical protein